MMFVRQQLLEPGENMVKEIRKHWIVYLRDFLLHTSGCLVLIALAQYISFHGAFLDAGPFQAMAGISQYLAMSLASVVIVFWISFFYFWTKNYFDVWYVTDQHIIAVNQKQLFERYESFMELSRIQDVSFEREGIVATFLGYGKLRVQSAGIEQEFIIKNVADVEGCAHQIMEMRDKAQKQLRGESL